MPVVTSLSVDTYFSIAGFSTLAAMLSALSLHAVVHYSHGPLSPSLLPTPYNPTTQ